MQKTLKELFERIGKSKNQLIGIYKDKYTKIYPDFADEILETYGNKIVLDYITTKQNIIIVKLKEE